MIDVGLIVAELAGLIAAKDLQGAELMIAEVPGANNYEQAVMIGPSDPDSPGFVQTSGRMPSLSNADVDQLEIGFIVRSWQAGTGDMPAQMSMCSALISRIREVVNDNIVRPGVWDRLEVGQQMYWHPVYTDKGPNCWVALSVVATVL